MFDTGSTSFMLICTMLVLLMTPGVAFFYGGLARRKNVVNTMFMSMAIIGVVGVLWIIAGWSFAYGGDGSNPFFGGFDQLGCASVVQDMLVEAQVVPEDAVYPAIIDVVFQAAFAMITCAIIWGAVAGRMKFGAMIAFVSIWVLVIYCPLAHMVWGGDGSFIGDQIGALDFAGGDVVHISSGLAGLVLCLLLGSRKEFGTVAHRPHNIPLVVLGVTLLWFGWFGFNGGSEFAADGIAALAIMTPCRIWCSAPLLDGGREDRGRQANARWCGDRPGCGLGRHHACCRFRRALGGDRDGLHRLAHLLLCNVSPEEQDRV